jgi:hypothetical protein
MSCTQKIVDLALPTQQPCVTLVRKGEKRRVLYLAKHCSTGPHPPPLAVHEKIKVTAVQPLQIEQVNVGTLNAFLIRL